MGTIDMHVHAFPDKLAKRAIDTLQGNCQWEPVGNGTIAALTASMDKADVDISTVCTIATKPDQTAGIFKWCKKIHDDRIEPLPSIHPGTKKPEKWMARFANQNFAGIKLHPMYQNFAFDDPSMDRIYSAAADYGLLVVTHCGRDIAFPPSDDRASPKRIRRVIDRHTNMKLLCTHMGGWRMWDQVEELLVGQDVYFETSFSLAELGPKRATDIIQHHGTNHVMLGSDWPWGNQTEQVHLVEALGLSHHTTEAIRWGNAAKLLGY